MAFGRKRKNITVDVAPNDIDYKDTEFLSSFVTETGKMVPSRITGTDLKTQRRISRAIKRARYVALLPYCDRH